MKNEEESEGKVMLDGRREQLGQSGLHPAEEHARRVETMLFDLNATLLRIAGSVERLESREADVLGRPAALKDVQPAVTKAKQPLLMLVRQNLPYVLAGLLAGLIALALAFYAYTRAG